MANERKTENFVRKHFSMFPDDICIEEQSSENIEICKLLEGASKKGDGRGCPDFIITYKNNHDFLIVIECKADSKNHENQARVNYDKHAVDGALLYASYLSRGFDVLAIAVSGESKEILKVSHFLHLKNEKKAFSVYGSNFLSAKDYLKNYLQSPEKLRQDYESLLRFTKELNEKLQGYKIVEDKRSLLISGILIALENRAFKKSYSLHKTPKSLADLLVQTISDELKSANLTNLKIENLKNQFSFIQNDTSLSNRKDVLKLIVDDIDNNINKFIKTHKYIDVLGRLYIEFLRYANSDKGLGIVLTPRHITELFSDLAQVNKDSVVYDNCAGTGGFLISAMKKMIQDAHGDSKKIEKIKEKSILGTEYQSHIFALAISNMYIHQDGKSNIIHGSCFDTDVMESVKNKKPNIGFLNPPYKSNKKEDVDELEFILNNLKCLAEGSVCVAIVPMQSALAQSGKVLQFKKQILEKHTLEAVLSMPDELFFDSKVGVVSCVMIFSAHKPHPDGKETYFGYYKNDGFVKRKNKGRIDACEKWEYIKKKWLENFMNRKQEAGISVNKKVNADMEWSAENYMTTNYLTLSSKEFIQTNLSYVTFLLGNSLTKEVSDNSFLNQNKILSLEINRWKFFILEDIFKITGSQTTPLLELEEYGKGQYPYVTTKATNNGVDNFYDFFTEKCNVLTIDSAVLGYCSYQHQNFSASDHVEKLIPKFELNKYIAMFLVTILNLEQYRYNYGRKCSQSRIKKLSVKLPTNAIGQPDWKFMESYIKSLPYSSSL